MKIYGDIKKQYGVLSKNDKQKMQLIRDELTGIEQAKGFSHEGLKNLYNLQTMLNAFMQTYSTQLISLLKQNHMVD